MKPKVLLVDDEPEFVELLRHHLGSQGCDVHPAFNGVEALHQARSLLPDVILLDLMLPDIDGASVCEILKSQPSTADIPVVVVSALDGMVMRNRSAEAGVARFFKKPVDFSALAQCVRGLVEDRESEIKKQMSDEDGAGRTR
jgi:CheY-like chemotaxis protein